MKCGSTPKGFTIVETMIFLAVSGALLFSAMSLMSGSQGKAQFNDALNDVQQQIDIAAGDLSTGYYGSSETVQCSETSGVISILTTGSERGSNQGCQFIGRLVTIADNSESMSVQSIIGLTKSADKDVMNLTAAKPQVFAASLNKITFKYGLKLKNIKIGVTLQTKRSVGFFTAFPKEDVLGTGLLQSGSLQNDFAALNPEDLNLPSFLNDYDATISTVKNPSDGITLCFSSGTNNQQATITIGGADRSATTTREIGAGLC
ncbi:MAG: hypothetical protein WCO19_00655 [Candidatus Saccharibacteria bacterium]